MRPSECVSFETNRDNLDIYIDGRRYDDLAKKVYIADELLHLPYQEICNRLRIVPDATNIEYVTPEYMSWNHGITTAFERPTGTVYLCSVPHYDGYRRATGNVLDGFTNSFEYQGGFFYFDAMIEEVQKEIIYIAVERKKLSVKMICISDPKLIPGNTYRLCFQFRGADADGNIILFLMQTFDPQKDCSVFHAIGNMEYTTENWNKLVAEWPILDKEPTTDSLNKIAFEKHLKAVRNGRKAEHAYLLGHDYQHGRGTSVNYEEAHRWYTVAASKGYIPAVLNLGFLYVCGLGCQKNMEKGIRLYKEAAEAGDTIAMCNLGKLYRDGNGVPQDYKAAYSYFYMASSFNDHKAEFLIADMYHRYNPGREAIEKEIEWYNKSAGEDEELLLNVEERKDKNFIDIKDVMARTSNARCIERDHELQRIQASVYVLNKESLGKDLYKIDAYYCRTCHRYYILESDYRDLKHHGIICCKVINCDNNTKGSYMSWNAEHLLKSYGYNVSKQANLSEKARHAILDMVIDNEILSREKCIEHIDFVIQSHANGKNMDLAISKWNKDLTYLRGGRKQNVYDFRIRKIYRK